MSTMKMQDGTELESWLKRATCQLSAASAARVRAEIQEHYESAREAALNNGATADGADREAVAVFGSARTANRQYRKVMVTTSEARLLREVKWEGSALCSRSWKRWLLLIPAMGIGASAWAFTAGQQYLALLLLV